MSQSQLTVRSRPNRNCSKQNRRVGVRYQSDDHFFDFMIINLISPPISIAEDYSFYEIRLPNLWVPQFMKHFVKWYWIVLKRIGCVYQLSHSKSQQKKDGQKRRRFVKHFSARLRISTASKCTHKELCSEFILWFT